MGHDSDLFALTIDDDLRGDVRPFADRGGDARRRHDLPFRAAVADDRGVRRGSTARRSCSTTTSRRRRSSRPTIRRCSGSRRSAAASWRRSPAASTWRSAIPSSTGRSSRRSASRRTGVMPIAVNTARITGAPPRPALERILARRADQHPLRRPDRPQQEDRGSHPAGGDVQALRRQLLPLHLRRPLRRRCRATTPRSGR